MNRISKSFAVFIILILSISSLSLLIIKPANAQTIPKPSVPEFTVKYADHSYNVPLTTVNYTNPYTGQQDTKTSGGYHVENMTIDVTIKNQPFTPTTIDGNTTGLFYVIRWKGHFENWTEHSDFNDVAYYNSYQGINYAIPATDSDYTVKSYSLSSIGNIPQGGLVDFQVKAQIGYTFLYYGGHIQAIGTNYHWVQESGWSNTQTVTIAQTSTSNPTPNPTLSTTNTPSPTPTPTVPEFPSLTIPLLLSIILGTTGLLVYHKKHKSTRNKHI